MKLLSLLMIISIIYIVYALPLPIMYSNQITSNIFIDKQYDNTNFYKAILYTGIIGIIISSSIVLLSLFVLKHPNHINLDYIE